jgi:hypothetical protein
VVTLGAHRSGWLLLAALTLAAPACGTDRLSNDEATQVAVDAFAAAGLDATVTDVVGDATVDRAGDGAFVQVHRVDLDVDGIGYEVGVSRTDGAVVRLVESRPGLTDAEAEAIAEHRADLDDDTARRAVVGLLVLAVAIVAIALLIRRARLAAERAASTADDEISLD